MPQPEMPLPDLASTSSITVPRSKHSHLRLYDLAKTVSIAGVVFIHSIAPRYTVLEGDLRPPTMAFFDTVNLLAGMFMMPVVFFASGFLLQHTHGYARAGGYVTFVLKKAYRLMVPYVVLTGLAFILRGFFAQYASRAVPFTWTEYMMGLLYPISGPFTMLWFLPVLMGAFMFGPLFERLPKMPVWQWAFVSAVMAALNIGYAIQGDFVLEYLRAHDFETHPLRWLYRRSFDVYGNEQFCALFTFDGLLKYLPYFWFGALAHRYQTIWNRLIHARMTCRVALMLMLTGGVIWNWYPGDEALYMRLTYFYGPVSCVMALGAAYRWSRRPTPFMDRVGKYSFTIYLLSWFFQQAALVVCVKVFPILGWTDPDLQLIASFAALSFCGLLGPLVVGHYARVWRLPGRFLIGVGQ